MNYYLLDNPPASQQFYPSRQNPFTGGILVHTSESVMDNVDIDTGAENIASFIARRSDPGCYHTISDSDSDVFLVPASYTAFHCAAPGFNSRTYGVSFACRSTELNPDDPWTQKAFKRVAAVIVGVWQEAGIDVRQAAVWKDAQELLSGPGLANHGDAQPVDRSDAFARHPRRAELEQLLVTNILEIAYPNPDQENEDMSMIVVDPRPGHSTWHVSGNTRYRLASQAEIDSLAFLAGAKYISVDPNDPDAVAGIVTFLQAHKDLGRGRKD